MPDHAVNRLITAGLTLLCATSALLTLPLTARALSPAMPQPRIISSAAREIVNLFSEEMQQASAKLKWRGERLTDDTVYAVALTGTSWELAWGNDHLFSLAWGDCRKVPTLGKRNDRNYASFVRDVDQAYASGDYRRAVTSASANFSLDEIGCDVNLKDPVGRSLMALGQPERAFPIFSAPFEPVHTLLNVSETNRKFREAAFDAANRAGLTKEAVAFALSLLLEPGADAPNIHQASLRYLEQAGVDIDRLLLGILQAPERLRGLPAYSYAAADLLAYRATPRLLPFLLHLANSDDVYLRGRALIGLGIVAYQSRPGDPPGWLSKVMLRPMHEYGISASERKLIDREIREAAGSDKYRLRANAAIAAALIGEEESVPLLQKLAKDKAYVLSGPGSGPSRTLTYPVRVAAAAGLARFGMSAETGSGEFSGKALDMAKRGGQDETNDRRNVRKEVVSQIVVSPLDMAAAAPILPLRR